MCAPYNKAGQDRKTMGDSWVIPTTIPALPCLIVGSTHWAEIQTILSTFLGITQEAPMGGSWVIPSVTSLTERSVWKKLDDVPQCLFEVRATKGKTVLLNRLSYFTG